MAENSKIEWTTHTFNPWRGCTKIAAGCANCYAARESKRFPEKLGIWGDGGTRVVAAESMWRKPLGWNKTAILECRDCGNQYQTEKVSDPQKMAFDFECGCGCCKYKKTRPRVFCASLADVFEDWSGVLHAGGKQPIILGKNYRASDGGDRLTMADVRKRLFQTINATPNIDWLLLTKRPENIRRMWPAYQNDGNGTRDFSPLVKDVQFGALHMPNVWLGTSIACQQDADRNVSLLLECRDLSPVLFLSCEPLIESIELKHLINGCQNCDDIAGCDCDEYPGLVDWIIVGGESGNHARPFCLEWDDDIRRQCHAAGVPFFNKQLGAFPVTTNCNFWDFESRQLATWGNAAASARIKLKDRKGGDWSEWPESLRVRQFPVVARANI